MAEGSPPALGPVAGANHRPNGVVKVKTSQWKLLAASVGGGAVIAMAALGAFGNIGFTGPRTVVSPVATQAPEQIATTTTPPTAPVTSVASPTVTASTPSGFLPAP